jgi:type 1 glutamine amidotransferase
MLLSFNRCSRSLCFLLVSLAAFGPLSGADDATVKPIQALLITGGGFHDYTHQKVILTEGIRARANVQWTIFQEDGDTRHELSLYQKPDWWKGYDIVVHNECFADVNDTTFVEKALAAVRDGVPAIVIHCTLHTFRTLPTDQWREFIGVSSNHHGKQLPINAEVLRPNDPIMAGFPPNWVTGPEELYSIARIFPSTTVLAQAYSTEEKKEDPIIWTNLYGGKTRVFGTSMAHSNATMMDPVYLSLLARGLLWACDKLDDKGQPKPGYGPSPK